MALQVLMNCVCGPINRSGSNSNASASQTPITPARKKQLKKTSEDLINKMWDCVRSNNGILVLMEMLHIKSPISDADAIRAMACRALVGLARSDPAKQIMSKLPIFSNGQLQQLVNEPILHEKQLEHLKFQKSALELLMIISADHQGKSIILRGRRVHYNTPLSLSEPISTVRVQ